jgi:hypothetical protein
MATKVRVTDRAIISALNTPGGGVFKWRDEVGKEVKRYAESIAPVNNPLDAEHRGGEVGTYQRSFDFDRRGSSGHHVIARLTNDAPHALYVEFGRSSSSKLQIFSMAHVEIHGIVYEGLKVRVGSKGTISSWLKGKRSVQRREALAAFEEYLTTVAPKIGERTQAREGYHIMSRALVAAMGSQGISARVD